MRLFLARSIHDICSSILVNNFIVNVISEQLKYVYVQLVTTL